MKNIIDAIHEQIWIANKQNHKRPDYVLVHISQRQYILQEYTTGVSTWDGDPHKLKVQGVPLVFTSHVSKEEFIPVYRQIRF